jgi:hypothetical protein
MKIAKNIPINKNPVPMRKNTSARSRLVLNVRLENIAFNIESKKKENANFILSNFLLTIFTQPNHPLSHLSEFKRVLLFLTTYVIKPFTYRLIIIFIKHSSFQ